MTLSVSSWIKVRNQELKPIYKKNFNLRYRFSKLQSFDLVDSNLKRCWDYIDEDYECFCVESKADNTLGNYIFSVYLTFNFHSGNAMVKRKKAIYSK